MTLIKTLDEIINDRQLSGSDSMDKMVDALADEIGRLTVFNAELLTALIQMETWARLNRVELDKLQGQETKSDSLCWQEIYAARAVIAKARELDQ